MKTARFLSAEWLCDLQNTPAMNLYCVALLAGTKFYSG